MFTQTQQPGGVPSSGHPHRTLNQCKGVICCKELLNCDKDEILSELKEQFVKDISNISVKSDSGGRCNTNIFIVTLSDRGLIGKSCCVSRSVIETSDRVDVYRSTSASSLSLGLEKLGIYTVPPGRPVTQ